MWNLDDINDSRLFGIHSLGDDVERISELLRDGSFNDTREAIFAYLLSIDSTECIVDAVIAGVLDIQKSYDSYFLEAEYFCGKVGADELMKSLKTIQKNLATEVRTLFGNKCTDDDIIKILQMRPNEVQASIKQIKNSQEANDYVATALAGIMPLEISLDIVTHLRAKLGALKLAKRYDVTIEPADILFSNIENPQSEISKFYETRFDKDWSVALECIESHSTSLVRP